MKKTLKKLTALLLSVVLSVLSALTSFAGYVDEGPGAKGETRSSTVTVSRIDYGGNPVTYESGGSAAASSEVGPGVSELDAPIPAFSDTVSLGGTLALLKAYDAEGYFIADSVRKSGADIMAFADKSGTATIDLDTIVHECCHMLATGTISNGMYTVRYYTGSGNFVPITFSKPFYTVEMARYIPERLRTFRYNVYVGAPSENLGANIEGVYGLLNEFMAYLWGMNNVLSMYGYYKAQNLDEAYWEYYYKGMNCRQAYAEFRFYILTYLLYARDSHPEYYNEIINNAAFRNVFKIIDTGFINSIKAFEAGVNDIIATCAQNGKNAYIKNGSLYIGSRGVGIDEKDYSVLMEEMTGNGAYVEMYSILTAQ